MRDRDDTRSSKALCRNTIEGHEHKVVGGADEAMNSSTARGTASVLKHMVTTRYSSEKERLSANHFSWFKSRPDVDVETAQFV